ncbi:MAG: NADH-quinone oxidoreductase subunit K [Desulfobacterales bacterium]
MTNQTAAISAIHFINPLPQVPMLTAIVVAVATPGVALSLSIEIYRQYNTLKCDDIQGSWIWRPDGTRPLFCFFVYQYLDHLEFTLDT